MLLKGAKKSQQNLKMTECSSSRIAVNKGTMAWLAEASLTCNYDQQISPKRQHTGEHSQATPLSFWVSLGSANLTGLFAMSPPMHTGKYFPTMTTNYCFMSHRHRRVGIIWFSSLLLLHRATRQGMLLKSMLVLKMVFNYLELRLKKL